MASQETALRKRQQIAKANRMMFVWVAGVSVVVGFAAVGAWFLLQKAMFNERVLSVKSDTASTLVSNNEVVDELKNQVRVLNTNQALKDSRADGNTEPVQVVLDALPAEANSSALGSSLQKKFLGANALTLETLNVDPVAGIEALLDGDVQDVSLESSESEVSNNVINFRFSVSVGNNKVNELKKLLQRLERSIRPIDLVAVTVEAQGDGLLLTVDGRSFYEPARTVELKETTVRP